jgi:D-sedoheptulose 7-phosphate isomerase
MNMNPLTLIKNNLEDSAKIKKDMVKLAPLILKIANETITALKKGGMVYVFGNGGSASDSQHMAAELVGRFNKEKQPLAAISLTTNTSILTAVGNDYGYEYSFSKQVEALAKKGDIVFAISTSGNAKNVLEAVLKAKRMKVKTVGLSGKGGGNLARACDLCLVIPSNSTARIQEAHITAIHILCELIEEAFVK